MPLLQGLHPHEGVLEHNRIGLLHGEADTPAPPVVLLFDPTRIFHGSADEQASRIKAEPFVFEARFETEPRSEDLRDLQAPPSLRAARHPCALERRGGVDPPGRDGHGRPQRKPDQLPCPRPDAALSRRALRDRNPARLWRRALRLERWASSPATTSSPSPRRLDDLARLGKLCLGKAPNPCGSRQPDASYIAPRLSRPLRPFAGCVGVPQSPRAPARNTSRWARPSRPAPASRPTTRTRPHPARARPTTTPTRSPAAAASTSSTSAAAGSHQPTSPGPRGTPSRPSSTRSRPTWRLVTITIGGNDLSYIGRLTAAVLRQASRRRRRHDRMQSSPRGPTEQVYAALANRMDFIARSAPPLSRRSSSSSTISPSCPKQEPARHRPASARRSRRRPRNRPPPRPDHAAGSREQQGRHRHGFRILEGP